MKSCFKSFENHVSELVRNFNFFDFGRFNELLCKDDWKCIGRRILNRAARAQRHRRNIKLTDLASQFNLFFITVWKNCRECWGSLACCWGLCNFWIRRNFQFSFKRKGRNMQVLNRCQICLANSFNPQFVKDSSNWDSFVFLVQNF